MAAMNKGFTLIEMVVTAGLIGLLSVGVVGIFISTIQGNYKAKLQAEVKEQGDAAITSMERVIRNSPSQPVCTGTTQVMFSQPGTGATYGYRIAGSIIEKTTDGINWSNIMGSGIVVSGATFTCITDTNGFTQGKVTIKFTATSNNAGGTLDQTFETTVAIRTIK